MEEEDTISSHSKELKIYLKISLETMILSKISLMMTMMMISVLAVMRLVTLVASVPLLGNQVLENNKLINKQIKTEGIHSQVWEDLEAVCLIKTSSVILALINLGVVALASMAASNPFRRAVFQVALDLNQSKLRHSLKMARKLQELKRLRLIGMDKRKLK